MSAICIECGHIAAAGHSMTCSLYGQTVERQAAPADHEALLREADAMPSYPAELLAHNYPTRIDSLLSGGYTPTYVARALIDKLAAALRSTMKPAPTSEETNALLREADESIKSAHWLLTGNVTQEELRKQLIHSADVSDRLATALREAQVESESKDVTIKFAEKRIAALEAELAAEVEGAKHRDGVIDSLRAELAAANRTAEHWREAREKSETAWEKAQAELAAEREAHLSESSLLKDAVITARECAAAAEQRARVPREPTEEMLHRGYKAGKRYTPVHEIRDIWRAMYDAAIAASTDQSAATPEAQGDSVLSCESPTPTGAAVAEGSAADPIATKCLFADTCQNEKVCTAINDCILRKYAASADKEGREVSELTPEKMARMFHGHYERLAPSFSYVTRKDSRVPFDDLPANNKALMIAVCTELCEWISDIRRAEHE